MGKQKSQQVLSLCSLLWFLGFFICVYELYADEGGDRYWEASLPASHIPSDSKMENFIRTKYSSKRWILSTIIPDDPSILDEIPENVNDESSSASDSVPLAIVKQSLQKQKSPPQQTNLLGSDTPPTSRRQTPELSTLRTESTSPPKSRPRVDRVSNQSLLGIEFDSPVRTQSAPQFPLTTTTTTKTTTTGTVGTAAVATSRNDLKNSILKLYAPKPVTAPSTPQFIPTTTTTTVGGSSGHSALGGGGGALGDLNSAFGSLSMATTTTGSTSYKSHSSSSSSGYKPPPLTTSNISSGYKSPPLVSPSTSTTTFSGFSSTTPLSFGQTTTAPPPKPPAQPTTFTIPIKTQSSSGISSLSTSPPTRASSSKILPTTTASSSNILPTSNYAPTFNLSKTSAPPTTTSVSAVQKPVQLLSSLTPTTTTTTSSEFDESGNFVVSRKSVGYNAHSNCCERIHYK